ncbi:hypothetical protein G6N82_00685 [Altererythrobacter sp. BO-6]|uniref:hypothetical protein n=1 Tax=Altererythrobacter sp. BO-6 TaxID=2604537 RepID=UPI0013E1198F|nr:hypothetical protein [Altererythrobacter sp. BO-6]QIG52873.1 hypothetical protein G6N82_00685 [Altererythrobacter sp. BO-6]
MGKRILKIALQVFGVALVLSGGLWTLQGLGIVMWPASSFMLADRSWALYGGITVLVGAILLWSSGRIAR